MATDLIASTSPCHLLFAQDDVPYEIVNGRRVAKQRSWVASLIATTLANLIGFEDPKFESGFLVVGGSYQYFGEDENHVRRPDASFIRREKLKGQTVPKGHSSIAPDLIIEVVSPGDTYEEIEARLEDHFRAGVSLAWVVSPALRQVIVHQAGGNELRRLREADLLVGEPVLPGFRCKVRDIFAPLDL